MRKAGQALASGAKLSPRARNRTARIAAAMATRPNASVSGGRSSTATFAKKNEPPHRTDRQTSSSQSAADIVNFLFIGRLEAAGGLVLMSSFGPFPPDFHDSAPGRDWSRSASVNPP